jgi:hypothetical protein
MAGHPPARQAMVLSIDEIPSLRIAVGNCPAEKLKAKLGIVALTAKEKLAFLGTPMSDASQSQVLGVKQSAPLQTGWFSWSWLLPRIGEVKAELVANYTSDHVKSITTDVLTACVQLLGKCF